MLATKQFCGMSNGSACNSKSYTYSHVLSSMKIAATQIEEAIRISWDWDVDLENAQEQIKLFLEGVKSLA